MNFGVLLGRFINIPCCPICPSRPRHQCICLNIGTVCWVFGIWLQTSLQQKGKFPSLKAFPLGPVYTGRNSEPWQARQSIGGVARVVVKCKQSIKFSQRITIVMYSSLTTKVLPSLTNVRREKRKEKDKICESFKIERIDISINAKIFSCSKSDRKYG